MRSGWGGGAGPKSVSSHLPLAIPCSSNSYGSPPTTSVWSPIENRFQLQVWMRSMLQRVFRLWISHQVSVSTKRTLIYAFTSILYFCIWCFCAAWMLRPWLELRLASSQSNVIRFLPIQVKYFLPLQHYHISYPTGLSTNRPLFLPCFPQRMLSSWESGV